jgi:hypothetical protein
MTENNLIASPRIHPWSEKKAPRFREQAPGFMSEVALFNLKSKI